MEIDLSAHISRLTGVLLGGLLLVGASSGYDVQGNLMRVQRVPGSTNEATDSLLTMGYDVLGRVIWMGDAGRNVVEVHTYDDQGLRVLVETYQGLAAPQILQKKQYRIYNEARPLISDYESVLE